MLVDKPDDAAKRLNMVVAPDSEVLWADAPLGQYRRRFRENQARAPDRTRTKMHQVPVIGEAVLAGILAHWRNNESIGETKFSDNERFEKAHTGNIDDWPTNMRSGARPCRAGS